MTDITDINTNQTIQKPIIPVINDIMEKDRYSVSYLAKKLGISRQTMWNRVDLKRDADLTTDKVIEILEQMEYKLVAVPKGTEITDGYEIVRSK